MWMPWDVSGCIVLKYLASCPMHTVRCKETCSARRLVTIRCQLKALASIALLLPEDHSHCTMRTVFRQHACEPSADGSSCQNKTHKLSHTEEH